MNKLLIIVSVFLFMSCEDSENIKETTPDEEILGLRISGETQGTTYNITYLGDTANYKTSIDSLLKTFDLDISLWVENSLINRINAHSRRDTVFSFVDSTKYFSVLFDRSREIYELTNGSFNPSVYPLVEAWGFGLKNKEIITPELIDSLKENIGFDGLSIDMTEYFKDTYFYTHTDIWKGNPKVRIDFNAIAQGYSVDLIGGFLIDRGIDDYMVEIGGEVLCRGKNQHNEDWTIAIDSPESDPGERKYQAIVHMKNRAIATSGSYRAYYIEDGVKYSHTIDPQTGYPVDHTLLSVSVLADDCATADAYATAFMVMGREKTQEFLIDNPNLDLDVYLIYDDNGKLYTEMSDGLNTIIEEIKEETP